VANVALPEPYVSLVEKQDQVFVSLNYRQEWDALTGSADGYPQVATFVKKDWAAAHPDLIAQVNDELANALQIIWQDPAAAVEQTQAELGFPPEVLLSSLQRTDFSFSDADKMAQEIRRYYQIIGRPLDETFDPFFYHNHR
jgi:NitT/TauT family transport system substrate-binding protein